MKVRITALKSTGWPKDAKVGDVVTIKGDEIPGWALGKCVEVEEAAKPAKTDGKTDGQDAPK